MLILGTDSCWKVCVRNSAIGAYCHMQSLVIGTGHLIQIRVCSQVPSPRYSFYAGIEAELIHRSLSPGELSLLDSQLSEPHSPLHPPLPLWNNAANVPEEEAGPQS